MKQRDKVWRDGLTPEQEAQIPVYRDRWIKIGLSTHRITVKMAEPLLRRFGKLVLGREPKHVIVCPSPVAAWKTCCELEGVDKKTPFVWSYLEGCHSAPYFAFYNFCKEVLKIPLSDKYDSYEALTRLSLVYPLENGIWVLADNPTAIHLENGVLHRDGGAAVEYTDDFAVYCLHGVRVSRQLACWPAGQLNPMDFALCTDHEERMEFVRKVGFWRIVIATGAKQLSRAGNFRLFELNLGGRTGRQRYLVEERPDSAEVMLFHAVSRRCRDVAAALVFRAGKTERKT